MPPPDNPAPTGETSRSQQEPAAKTPAAATQSPPASSRRPAPIVGLRRRQRVSGEPYLTATIAEDMVIPAGSTFDLRRLHDGSGPGPEFALLIAPPRKVVPLTKAVREQAAADRLDGSAIRTDPRESGEGKPW